jgi:GNAT superfamily N-acetyltransferase
LSAVSPDVVISLATSAEAIVRCFPVMSQLRPHLREEEFVAQVRRQQVGGYLLAALEAESRVRALAGYRFGENLAWGPFCYVDDLVTDAGERSRGFGRLLLGWVKERAREAGCVQFHLDSGVQRFQAHRFYFTQGMVISSHHFALPTD